MKPFLHILAAALLMIAPVCAQATDYEAVERRLGEMVAEGELTLQQAQVMLHALREHNEHHGDHDHAHHRPDHEQREAIVADFMRWLESIGPQLRDAVEQGRITEEQAWEQWTAIKEKQIAPKLKQLIGNGFIPEAEGWEIWLGIEAAETGQRLKHAVERGELTEAQAREKWEDYEKQLDKKREAIVRKAEQNEWRKDRERAFGQRIKAALERGELTEAQAKAKWEQFRRELDREAKEKAARQQDRPERERAGDDRPERPRERERENRDREHPERDRDAVERERRDRDPEAR